MNTEPNLDDKINDECKECSKEQAILNAAEKIFLEHGFNEAKTSDIAKEAGVTHAMLHYYFRTKENVFKMIFQKMSGFVSKSFDTVLEKDLPFLDRLKLGIETHFNIIAAHKKIPFFIYSEIIKNDKRKQEFLEILQPRATALMLKLQVAIDDAASKGSIRPIDAHDLVLNIISLNAASILAFPFFDLNHKEGKKKYEDFLNHRRENNVNLILRDIKL